MVLFKRNRDVASRSSSPTPMPDTDWADPDSIRNEWKNVDEDPAGWQNGWDLFEDGPAPAQRFNVAEYMTRALRLHLSGDGPLPEPLVAETCRRVLVMLDGLPAEPALLHEFAPRLIRLPLAVMRERRWQPVDFGGDGTVDVKLDTPSITAAVETTKAPEGRHLDYFFQRT